MIRRIIECTGAGAESVVLPEFDATNAMEIIVDGYRVGFMPHARCLIVKSRLFCSLADGLRFFH